jgi:hypothetical protein
MRQDGCKLMEREDLAVECHTGVTPEFTVHMDGTLRGAKCEG